MNFKIYLSSLVFFLCTQVYPQTNINVGQVFSIKSEILNEEREIQVFLPNGYSESDKEYPVLYILDGQRYFLNGILYQKTLQWQEKTPDFIVIGINTDNNKRRKLFYEQSETFTQFLEQELISFVDKNYRTSQVRMLFGWEMGGGLAIEILARYQKLFTTYLIASPTHLDENRIAMLKKRLIDDKKTSNFIYYTLSPLESWAIESIDSLSNTFKENASHHIKWHYTSLKNEHHHSTPTRTIHEGLNAYFMDYIPIRFYSLKEFEDFGAMKALKIHYKKRGEKYNIAEDIHKDTKHFLLLQAMKEDNYKAFKFFMEEFDDYYKSKTRDLWFNRYAQFYLKHHNFDQAFQIFNAGLEKFENSSLILNGLGDFYFVKNNTKKAKSYYHKAVEIAIKNSDSNLIEYQTDLEKLK
ncbi:esterase [Flavobacteriaceae bacterium R38]|nr:esterase [Flavobacteriaceae bacterium R38]